MDELTRRVWRKSTYSVENAKFVEFAGDQDGCAVRDSKDPAGPVISFGSAQWALMMVAISRGQFG